MGSTITFLGTAGDSLVMSKMRRGCGGIVLNFEHLQFHIDPGPGALIRANLSNINPREHTCVISTSDQIHRTNDLNCIIDSMTRSGIDKKGVLIAPLNVLSGENSAVREKYKTYVEKTITIEPGKKIGIDVVDIEGLHTTGDSVGLKISLPDFVLGYTSSTGYKQSIADQFKGVDVLILNVTFPNSIDYKTELNRETASKIIETAKPKLAVITNFGIKMIQADPLYEAREIQIATDTTTIAATDGLQISPESYSAKSAQKRLRGF
jgi:ribonuclease BN (tRNA processing enzyme)